MKGVTAMTKPTILVTGFEPFLDYETNSSWIAAEHLPAEVAGCRIVLKRLPVVWYDCVEELETAIAEVRPRTLIAFGQGYPWPPVLIERVGINLCSGPDNSEDQDMREIPLYYNGPAAYFSTFPFREIHDRLQAEGIPAVYSYSAGVNQCNCTLYSALHLAATRFQGMTAGFIHLPTLPYKDHKGMSAEDLKKTALCAVEETAKLLSRPRRPMDEYRKVL